MSNVVFSTRLFLVVILGGVLGSCSVGPSSNDAPSVTTSKALPLRGLAPSGASSYVDAQARCRFVTLSSAYRIRSKHYPVSLPASKVRHRILVTPDGDKSLARVDLYDNPNKLGVREWVQQHLAYLLDGAAAISDVSVGARRRSGLLIRRPRSPQSFASRTVVMTDGWRVVVIDGTDVEEGKRREAFEQLVSSFDFEEVTP